jgi:hypothetical protein
LKVVLLMVKGGGALRLIASGVSVAVCGIDGPEQAHTKGTTAATRRNQGENLMLQSSDEDGFVRLVPVPS